MLAARMQQYDDWYTGIIIMIGLLYIWYSEQETGPWTGGSNALYQMF